MPRLWAPPPPAAQVVNLTVLAVESERDDPRLEAWEGQTLAAFYSAGNSSISDGAIASADVHALVSHLSWCPLAGGNVLTIVVRGGCQCAAPPPAAAAPAARVYLQRFDALMHGCAPALCRLA